MNVPARAPRQEDVADRHDLLRFRRHALEPEARAHDPFVHRPALRERRLLAMIGDRNAERPRVLERRAHQMRALHGPPVVAHRDGAGRDHLAELGERFAALADGDRADRVDARRVGDRSLPNDESDRGLVVGDGIGIRHRAHRCEAAGNRGARAGRDGLHFFAPRLAKMAVHVDEARRDDEARAIDRLETVAIRRLVRHARTDRLDSVVDDQHVGPLVERLRRIDHASATQQNRAAHRSPAPPPRFADSANSGLPPDSKYNTAMRTATPFVTCSRITLKGPSATSESISTPRFIGPGWRMRMSRLARSSRSRDTPNTRLYSRCDGM